MQTLLQKRFHSTKEPIVYLQDSYVMVSKIRQNVVGYIYIQALTSHSNLSYYKVTLTYLILITYLLTIKNAFQILKKNHTE